MRDGASFMLFQTGLRTRSFFAYRPTTLSILPLVLFRCRCWRKTIAAGELIFSALLPWRGGRAWLVLENLSRDEPICHRRRCAGWRR